MGCFHPEPLCALKVRYPAALEQTYDEAEVVAGRAAKPSGPEHRFDFEEGVVMIVTREKRARDGRTVTHVSASLIPDTPLADSLKFAQVADVRDAIFAFRNRAAELYADLSGDHRPMTFLGLMSNHVHWHIPE